MDGNQELSDEAMALRMRVERIDVERAQELLSTMKKNRAVRPGKVARYVSEISADDWSLNGETIKIDREGRLIDGEHRLRAVIKSGLAIESIVVRGVSTETRVTVDTGAARSLSDHLRMEGYTNYKDLSSAVTHSWNRFQGNVRGHDTPAHREAVRHLLAHPGLEVSTAYLAARQKEAAFSLGGQAIALHYEMSDINAEEADDFWYKVCTGIGVWGETDPIYILRRRLEDDHKSRTAKIDRVTRWAFMIKTWNSYQIGEPRKTLVWKAGGMNPEPFPELHGGPPRARPKSVRGTTTLPEPKPVRQNPPETQLF